MKALVLFLAVAVSAFAQSSSTSRLDNSPRHQEWVEIKRGEDTVHAFVVYPEVKEKAMAVLVIHENRGLTDWVRTVADRLAEAGYIAIAPDLLSGKAPGGGRTKDFPSQDEATQAIGKLVPADVAANLGAVADYVTTLPAANGKLSVIGFCWGGGQTWRVALSRPGLLLACPFYGTAPKDADYAKVSCQVQGFYGGNDARVNSTLEATSAGMKAAGKTFEPVLYEGAGHAYMRSGEAADATPANKAAMTASWERLLKLLATAAK